MSARRSTPAHGENATINLMQIEKMLAELRTERDQLNEAILVMERLAVGRGRRRGRPPAWMVAGEEERQAAGEQKQKSRNGIENLVRKEVMKNEKSARATY
jgi:hypothetical protein